MPAHNVLHRILPVKCSAALSQNSGRRTLATLAAHPPQLAVAVVLNRAPIITRTPTKFERAFFKYQARIQRALHNPFPYEFYFKPGSILEQQFNEEERLREEKAYGKDFIAENKCSSIAVEAREDDEPSKPRRNRADDMRDTACLERHGSRNLYLLVEKGARGEGGWQFPKGKVQLGELLHEAARSRLLEQCGLYMNTWIVGRRPIGCIEDLQNTLSTQAVRRTFFFKGHIFAGQIQAQKGVTDFAWLTKEEIKTRVSAGYWIDIRDMLSDA